LSLFGVFAGNRQKVLGLPALNTIPVRTEEISIAGAQEFGRPAQEAMHTQGRFRHGRCTCRGRLQPENIPLIA